MAHTKLYAREARGEGVRVGLRQSVHSPEFRKA